MSLSKDIYRLSIGYIYLHFGVLKLFDDLSSAEPMVTHVFQQLSLSQFGTRISLMSLGILEAFIGLALLFDLFRRTSFYLFVFHMLGTLTPLVLVPEFVFKVTPFTPNMEGQYILKNFVILTSGIVLLHPSQRGKIN